MSFDSHTILPGVRWFCSNCVAHQKTECEGEKIFQCKGKIIYRAQVPQNLTISKIVAKIQENEHTAGPQNDFRN